MSVYMCVHCLRNNSVLFAPCSIKIHIYMYICVCVCVCICMCV